MRTASNFDSNRLRVDTETDCTPKEYKIERRASNEIKKKSIITAVDLYGLPISSVL